MDRQPGPEQVRSIAQEYFQQRSGHTAVSVEPTIVLIAGQPGAGKTSAANAVAKELQGRGGYVRVDADRLRERIPGYAAMATQNTARASAETQPDAQRLVRELREITKSQRRNIIEEGTFRDPASVSKFVDSMHRSEYQVQLRVLAVPEALSQVGIYARCEEQHARGIKNPRFVDDAYHASAAASLVKTIQNVEGKTDHVLVQDRGGKVLFDSDKNRDGSAVEALQKGRAVTPAVLVEAAKGWDAVAQSMDQRRADPATDYAVNSRMHRARAHFLMRGDPDAQREFQKGASPEADAQSQALAVRHGKRLASAVEQGRLDETTLEKLPELRGAYRVLANEHLKGTQAGLSQEQMQQHATRALKQVADHLRSGRPVPDPQLAAAEKQRAGLSTVQAKRPAAELER